jgi:cell division protein FtsI/penicillin-binding protein 2
MTNSVVDSKYAPRGRIFDRNYKLLVDNKLVPVIYYLNTNKDNSTNQIKEAYKLAQIIDIDVSKLSLKMLKDFYLVSNNCDSLISDKEWDKYYLDELSYNDIYKMKLERIDESIFNDYSVIDK